jgi:NDP-sugar pyrophosphorylase family protein
MKKAVILAGGLGSRLKPITDAIPKALLPIGEKSVLEIQIQRLVQHGFHKIFIATNYKADYVESFIGDGTRLGAHVNFSRESKPLGTCGPLTLLRQQLQEPFVLMNGDILSTIDFSKFYKFGLKLESCLTVATKELRTPFNFGSVRSNGIFIDGIDEKPDLINEIVAGIYFMSPEVFCHIPVDTYFGMDQLIKLLLHLRIRIGRYLMQEYWLDIGRLDDYNEAQVAYDQHFK